MSNDTPTPFATLLNKAVEGDRAAAEQLLPEVYTELRKLAAARLAALPAGQTLQATALVHEAYVRLVGSGDPGWKGRGHFFGAAARAMRNVLVDHARARNSLKRGGDRDRRALLDGDACQLETSGANPEAERTLRLDELITRLEQVDPRKAELITLRFFVGLTHEQIAEVLSVTVRTVERDWQFAKAWLHAAMNDDPKGDHPTAGPTNP